MFYVFVMYFHVCSRVSNVLLRVFFCNVVFLRNSLLVLRICNVFPSVCSGICNVLLRARTRIFVAFLRISLRVNVF